MVDLSQNAKIGIGIAAFVTILVVLFIVLWQLVGVDTSTPGTNYHQQSTTWSLSTVQVIDSKLNSLFGSNVTGPADGSLIITGNTETNPSFANGVRELVVFRKQGTIYSTTPDEKLIADSGTLISIITRM